MKTSTLLRSFLSACASLCVCAAVQAAGVVYVDASGIGQYTTIQAAIDAAVDGDVILVRTGTYAGFTIDNRRVFVIADASAVVQVTSKVTVRNTLPNGLVLVAGLQIEGLQAITGTAETGLEILNDSGHVRIQSCTVHGGLGLDNAVWGAYGGNATSIVNSSKVAFVGCSLIGGNGGGSALWVYKGGDGGHGAVEQGSAVAFYDCLLKGGVGGVADYLGPGYDAGDGGDGCQVLDYGILASGCEFRGGMGGGWAYTAGDGGNGLVVNSGAQSQLIGNTYAGGSGGLSYQGTFGQSGLPQTGGGVFHNFTGAARKLAAPVLAAEHASLPIQLTGEPGDRVWLFSSAAPGFVYVPIYAGMLLVPFPAFMTGRPVAVLPPSGTASVVVPIADVPAGMPVRRQFWQGLVVSASGQVRLSSPLHVVVLNCSDLLPDCNGNASCDSCDLVLATSLDCDKNGVPDECQPDCNSNGVIDPCDILNGTSPDLNHNLIPDECEPQATWYVDVNAAPGGNGSAATPFQTLHDGFTHALTGHTIRVANGLYQGPLNRNLDFARRDFVVESTGGAANCIIDCQLQGRAFNVLDGITAATRIEGFTIRNGKIDVPELYGGGMYILNASPVVRQCVFENCQGYHTGGGLALRNSGALIEGCSFIGNQCVSNRGGGASIYSNANARMIDCNFVNNFALDGGGLFTESATVRLERCFFQLNRAAGSGAGISGYGGELFVDQCWIAGGTAASGGAIEGWGGSQWHVTNCTLVDNKATQRAGAVYFFNDSSSLRSWRNCVLWNNTSPSGTPIHVDKGPLDIAWCDMQGGQASVTLGASATLTWGPGNLALDPQFVDADGPDNNPLTYGDNDYRLSLSSPCVDAGENASVAPDWFDLDGDGNVTEPVPLDFDGLNRFVDIPSAPDTGSGTPPLVDFGAWERRP